MSQHIQDTSHQDQKRRMLAETTAAQEKQYGYGQAMWTLALNLRGELILPGDPAYEAARGVWNGKRGIWTIIGPLGSLVDGDRSGRIYHRGDYDRDIRSTHVRAGIRL